MGSLITIFVYEWLSGGGMEPSVADTVTLPDLGMLLHEGRTMRDALVADLAALPEVGVTYAPPEMTVATAAAAGTYFKSPSFYIAYLGLATDGKSSIYQIDAVGYGGRADAVAVVESTYKLQAAPKDLGGL